MTLAVATKLDAAGTVSRHCPSCGFIGTYRSQATADYPSTR